MVKTNVSSLNESFIMRFFNLKTLYHRLHDANQGWIIPGSPLSRDNGPQGAQDRDMEQVTSSNRLVYFVLLQEATKVLDFVLDQIVHAGASKPEIPESSGIQ